jgi:hypothetical protein
MLSFFCLVMFGLCVFVIYHKINLHLADFFSKDKYFMLLTSCILASVITGILYNYVQQSALLSTSSNVQDNFYISRTDKKIEKPLEGKYNISSEKQAIDAKEIEEIIKCLNDPEELKKLIKTLNIIAVGIEEMHKDNK